MATKTKTKWRKNPAMHRAFKERKLLDGHCCTMCGECDSEKLTVHHLYGGSKYPSLRCNIWNLTTMCHNCHCEYHRMFNGIVTHKMITPDTFLVFLRMNQYQCNDEGIMQENKMITNLIEEVLWRGSYLRKIAKLDE